MFSDSNSNPFWDYGVAGSNPALTAEAKYITTLQNGTLTAILSRLLIVDYASCRDSYSKPFYQNRNDENGVLKKIF